MNTKITNIEQFIEKNFDSNSSDYIVIEAKILNSFINRLVNDHGFSIVSVFDGEELNPIVDNDRFKALDYIFSVDDCTLNLKSANGEKANLYLVLGNGDATTIADSNVLSEELESLINKVFAESVKTHSKELYDLNWSGYIS